MSTSNYKRIMALAEDDVSTLQQKGLTYGDSWKARGGVGAFMMLARKWDRIENIVKTQGYDIFKAGDGNAGDIMDDIADLRRYLLLVEDEVVERRSQGKLTGMGAIKGAEYALSNPLRGAADQPGSAAPAYVKQAGDRYP